MNPPTPTLQITQLSKKFGETAVLTDITLSLFPGEIACILGPSGGGKTTLMRIIAGLDCPDKGDLWLGDKQVSHDNTLYVPIQERHVGLVFQDYALFPHLSVANNIGFGLRKWSKTERKARVTALAEMLGLLSLIDRMPQTLSGGQQQRVALARSLAPSPRLLLLDEPFSGLDTVLRTQLCDELRRILKEENITAICVTHHQQDAFVLGDKIGILAEGKLHQFAPPEVIYNQPASPFVAQFLGEGERVPVLWDARAKTLLLGGISMSNIPFSREYPSGAYTLLIRAHHVQVTMTEGLSVHVRRRTFLGDRTLFEVIIGDIVITAEYTGYHPAQPGECIKINFCWSSPILFE
jgi:iron(III) transport system ATP-binding protein